MAASSHHIFMSHSHIDNDFGTRLAQDLRRLLGDEGAVWYDVLGLSTQVEVEPKKVASQPDDPGAGLLRQMEAAFAEQDWIDVLRKADYQIRRVPSVVTA